MTSYGTIPTSSQSPPPINLDYVSRAKGRIKAGLGTRRAWRQVLDYHHMDFPNSFHALISRVRCNLGYFQMNYAIVVLIVLFLSLIYHPTALIVFVVMMALWLFLYFLRDEPLAVFGKVISDRLVLIVLGILTIVVLAFTRATWNIVAAVLIGLAVVLVHASVRRTDDLNLDEESGGGLLFAQSSS